MENPPFGRSILLTSAYRVPHNLPTNNLGNEPSKSPRESFSSSFVQSTIVCIVQLGTISESRDLGKMPYSYYALVIKSENHQTVWVVNKMRISYCSRYDLESNSTKKKRKSVFNNITWLILFKWDSFFLFEHIDMKATKKANGMRFFLRKLIVSEIGLKNLDVKSKSCSLLQISSCIYSRPHFNFFFPPMIF